MNNHPIEYSRIFIEEIGPIQIDELRRIRVKASLILITSILFVSGLAFVATWNALVRSAT